MSQHEPAQEPAEQKSMIDGGGGDRSLAKLCPTLVTPWTATHQVPLSMGFPRQESWSGLPFPSPGDLPDPGIEPASPTWQADSLQTELQGKPIDDSSDITSSSHGSVPPELRAKYWRCHWRAWPDFPMGAGAETEDGRAREWAGPCGKLRADQKFRARLRTCGKGEMHYWKGSWISREIDQRKITIKRTAGESLWLGGGSGGVDKKNIGGYWRSSSSFFH